MELKVEPFFYNDGSLSHYSVVAVDEQDEIVELETCVIHATKEDAEQELLDLLKGGVPNER